MPANAIDLTTLADVKAYLMIPVTATADDALLQELITSVSQYWLTRTSRASLNSVNSYTERYDGNGKDFLLLTQFPIVAITSLTVDGMPIPQSTDYFQSGWAINQEKSAIVLIGNSYSFWFGRLNVAVTYTAGYSATPYDVAEAVRKHVAVNYKRRATTDQGSIALPQGGGTTSFRSWEMPPECASVLERYRRIWP